MLHSATLFGLTDAFGGQPLPGASKTACVFLNLSCSVSVGKHIPMLERHCEGTPDGSIITTKLTHSSCPDPVELKFANFHKKQERKKQEAAANDEAANGEAANGENAWFDNVWYSRNTRQTIKYERTFSICSSTYWIVIDLLSLIMYRGSYISAFCVSACWLLWYDSILNIQQPSSGQQFWLPFVAFTLVEWRRHQKWSMRVLSEYFSAQWIGFSVDGISNLEHRQ